MNDFLDESKDFHDRLDLFKARVQIILQDGITRADRCSFVSDLLMSVQCGLCLISPLNLPPERVMLYTGPTTVDDPLLLSSVIVDFIWMICEEIEGCNESNPLCLQMKSRLIEISTNILVSVAKKRLCLRNELSYLVNFNICFITMHLLLLLVYLTAHGE